MPEPPSTARSATIAYWIAIVAGADAVLGIVGIHLGVWSPLTGFYLYAAGAVLGSILALITAGVGLIQTRGGRDALGRRRVLTAFGIGAALVATVAIGGSPGSGLPPINDITTDLDDPPVFRLANSAPENIGADMAYPADFVAQVREAYPDLAPIAVTKPAAQAFERAVATAEELGWEIVDSDPAAGVFEARHVTSIFRFVDDISVRVRSTPGGAQLDLRSRSRVGRGDVGANAARIRAFADAY